VSGTVTVDLVPDTFFWSKVPVVHYGGNVANYNVKLEADVLNIAEYDDNLGFSIRSPRYGAWEVHKDPDGSPAWHVIHFPRVHYWDLDGDGIFDWMLDSRGPSLKASILVNDCFIPVWGSGREGSEKRTAYSPDRTIQYVFEEGKWRIKE
jgi:hypothetical protein